MRGLKRVLGVMTAGALLVTALPVTGADATAQAASLPEADRSVRLLPGDASPFHDTDGDGFGEFEGWGTSLCWWANRLGYSEEMTAQAAKYFFSDEGLDMNIGRYNVGGGDLVGETQKIPVNEKAQIFDIADTEDGNPSYQGSSMSVSSVTKLASAAYTASDADFGITKGETVGNFSSIGYINQLGTEYVAGASGDNLTYKVSVSEAGEYTVKLLFTLNGTNSRSVAIRMNGDSNTDKAADADTVNADVIASANSQHLFRVTFSGVSLNGGENTIAIGGSDGWTLDFVKMAVVKSGEEGVIDAADEFLHSPHIKRSDSVVPGYAKDVTKITAGGDYSAFDRADEDCGYAWNYDWDADKNQMNILKAAAAASGEEFIAEAFSNSPPYFMTNSGCSSGATDSGEDNLRADSYHAFAVYMADVITHWAEEGVIDFQSATPMNEPDTTYWGANSNKQEGCHFDPGNSQSNIIEAFAAALIENADAATDEHVKEVLTNIILSASDETDIDKAITNYKALSDAAKEAVTRIDTHTYSGSKRQELSELAEQSGENLWMSEVDGAYTAGSNAGEMSAALGLAQRMITDLNGLKSSAWILWNAVDMHVDADEERDGGFDADTLEELYGKTSMTGGYWGIAIGDHNNQKVVLTKKYYGYGQLSRYIRPGYSIISSTDTGMLTAYDPKGHKAVIVALNTGADEEICKFDLGSFSGMGTNIQAIRSSGSLESGENWADVSASCGIAANAEKKYFTAALKANSITTFVVDGVTYDPASDPTGSLEEIALTSSMVTGSTPYNNSTTNTVDKVVDGDFGTFFDGVSEGWVQIDLGSVYRIDAVGYAPRNSYESRCNGATFYGSNDGQNWTALYTVSGTPSSGTITKQYSFDFATESNCYRYVKYSVTASGNCNVSELKLYGKETDLASVIADYEEKAKGHTFEETSKAAFDQALAAAKEVAENTQATEEEKTAALISVVTAYDAMEEIIDTKYTYDSITGVKGAELYDDNGVRVQAHGGQVQKITYDYDYDGDGKIGEDEHEFWYWIGEDKTNDYRPCPGIHAYISKDLYNWKDMGLVLKTVADWDTFTTAKYFTDLYGDLTEEEQRTVYADLWTDNDATDSGCVIERPKMLYNDTTEKYVVWFHADGQTPDSTGGNYAKAKAGVAVSDSPFGPFKLQGSYLLNCNEDADHGFDSVGGHVRDMNLFKDDNGDAYVLYSSDGNKTMHIAKLNEEYTNVAKPQGEAEEGVDFTRNFIGESREAPAMFKYHDKYYLITSGCTGWQPNQASYAVADSPLGPWTTVGDPCTDSGSSTTYDTQSTCVIPVDPENGKFIYMGDRWYNPEVTAGAGAGGSLKDSRYVWLPIEFLPGDQIALRRYSNWTLAELEGKGSYQIVTELPTTAVSVEDLKTKMPDTVTIKQDSGETEELSVTWSGYPTAERALGTVALTGTFGDGSSFNHKVNLVDEKLIYFFDSGVSESDYVTAAAKTLGAQLRNQAADQAYTGTNRAGYTGIVGTDLGTKNAGSDVWAHGWYAMGNKNIEYAFELEAGTYTVATGYQEWWNTARATKLTVTDEDGELISDTFTLASTDKSLQRNVSFTIDKASTIKVTVSKTGSSDPVMSWIAVMQDEKTGELIDKTVLNDVIAAAEELDESVYTAASREIFRKAYEAAKNVQSDAGASKEELTKAAETLKSVMAAMVTIRGKLEQGIAANAPQLAQDAYTAVSFGVYAQVLKQVQALLEKEDLAESDVDEALKMLSDAKSVLEIKKAENGGADPGSGTNPDNGTNPGNGTNQGSVSGEKSAPVIIYTDSYEKTYGDKPFALEAELAAGNGALSFTSSDPKVADVSAQGQVSVQGIGVCTITIQTAATEDYSAASAQVSITVKPKKVTVKSAKPAKGKKLTVKWNKDTKVTGYEVQVALNKSFKSGKKTMTVKKASKNSAVLTKLKKGKKYYVRVRAYKTVSINGKNQKLYSDWSKVKTSSKIK